jgi:hypothetical protein
MYSFVAPRSLAQDAATTPSWTYSCPLASAHRPLTSLTAATAAGVDTGCGERGVAIAAAVVGVGGTGATVGASASGVPSDWFEIWPSSSPMGVSADRSASLIWFGTMRRHYYLPRAFKARQPRRRSVETANRRECNGGPWGGTCAPSAP